MKKLTILVLLLMFATFAISAQAQGPTAKDVNVVNIPDVNVVNLEPVPVSISSERTPWQGACVNNLEVSDPEGECNVLNESGERVTITYISVHAVVPIGQNVFAVHIRIDINGTHVFYFIPMTKYSSSFDKDYWHGGGQVLMYANQGSSISANWSRFGASDPAFCDFAFSGFSEPQPPPSP